MKPSLISSRPLLFVATVAALSASSLFEREAHATDPVAAEQLFADGKRLIASDNVRDACPKFEESQRLDPGIGTAFNLADCNERLGRSATAWAQFLEVAAQARGSGQQAREEAARARAAALESRVPRLSIRINHPDSKMEISRDGSLLGQAQWNSAMPIDPGEHTVVVQAPGKIAWEKRVVIGPTTKDTTLEVPLLVDAPLPAPAVLVSSDANPGDDDTIGRTQRIGGLGVMGLGLVGLGVGTAFGIASRNHRDDASEHCIGNRCDASGVASRDDAIRAGNASTVAFAVGGVATITGAVLFFTAPSAKKEQRALRASTMWDSRGCGVLVEGQFQ